MKRNKIYKSKKKWLPIVLLALLVLTNVLVNGTYFHPRIPLPREAILNILVFAVFVVSAFWSVFKSGITNKNSKRQTLRKVILVAFLLIALFIIVQALMVLL